MYVFIIIVGFNLTFLLRSSMMAFENFLIAADQCLIRCALAVLEFSVLAIVCSAIRKSCFVDFNYFWLIIFTLFNRKNLLLFVNN